MQSLLVLPEDAITYPPILVIEDSDEDFYAFLRAVQKLEFIETLPHKVLRLQNGDDALDYLFRQGDYQEIRAPLPAAILLDLNLPGTDGRDIIRRLKHTPTLQILPIVVFSTSSNPVDIQTCYEYGVNCYMLKPMGMAEMQRTIGTLFQYWFQLAVLPSHVQFMP